MMTPYWWLLAATLGLTDYPSMSIGEIMYHMMLIANTELPAQ